MAEAGLFRDLCSLSTPAGPRAPWRWGGSQAATWRFLGRPNWQGRSYSATLVAAVAELLADAGLALKDLGGIVAVNGPGSFTGVRVGLSAVKGLAEAAQIPVVAISRLEVLSRKSGVPSCCPGCPSGRSVPAPGRAWTCAPGAAGRGQRACGHQSRAAAHCRLRRGRRGAVGGRVAGRAVGQISRRRAAADALRLGEARLVAGGQVDLALLDGHYLRRSDAEIFGEAAAAGGNGQ